MLLLQQGFQCQHDKTLANKWGMDEGMRATFDILRPLISPKSKRYTVHQKFCIMNVACDGVWTQGRAQLAGYRYDGRCRCGAPDTVLHRLAECERPEARQAREDAEVPNRLLEQPT